MSSGSKAMRIGRDLELGDRVRLTELGASRCPRVSARAGVVTTLPRFDSGSAIVGVLFDGNKRATMVHRSYVELYDAS